MTEPQYNHIEPGDPRNPKPYRICGSPRTKHPGEICTKRAGYDTDHKGYGRCKFHGGRTPSGINIKHGMNAKKMQNRMREAYIRKVEEESIDIGVDPIDLRAELAVQRDLLNLFLYRNAKSIGLSLPVELLESGEQAMGEVYSTNDEEIDIEKFIKIVFAMTHEIAATTDKISGQRKDAVMSYAELNRQAGRIRKALELTLEEFISDEQQRAAALERFIDRSGTRSLTSEATG